MGGGAACSWPALEASRMRRLSWEDCASARKGWGREEWRRVSVSMMA